MTPEYLQVGAFRLFDQMSWPTPGERLSEVEWRLRYGTPSKADLSLAASVLSAYTALIGKPQKTRNHICKHLKEPTQ